MKNHVKVDGKLLQTNKRVSQLKMKQREWITTEFYRLYHQKMASLQTTEKLTPTHRGEVISSLYEKIQEREIWIPFDELEKFVFGKINRAVHHFSRNVNNQPIDSNE